MTMQSFQPQSLGDAKVGVRGILRDGEMLQPLRTEVGDFHSAAFPVMESLSSASRRKEERSQVQELEAEIARLQAEKLAEERRFKEELDLLRKEVESQAFRQGQEQGYAQAMEEHQSAQEQMRAQWAQMVQNMGAAQQDFLDQSDRTLNVLLFAALRRITGHWAGEQALAVQRAVQACLAFLGNEQRAVLYFSEADREEIERALGEWVGVEHSRVEFDLQYSSKLSPGACHMETAAGSVESSVEIMLSRMESELCQILGLPQAP